MDLDSAPKNSASIANREKLRAETRDNYVVAPSEVVRRTRFICQV